MGLAGGLTDVIGPFELHGHVGVSMVVGLDSFYDGEGGEVLYKYNGGTVREGKGVVEAC